MTKKILVIFISAATLLLLGYFFSYWNCARQLTEEKIIERRNEAVEKERAKCLEDQSEYQVSPGVKSISGCYFMTVDFVSIEKAINDGKKACKINPFSSWL